MAEQRRLLIAGDPGDRRPRARAAPRAASAPNVPALACTRGSDALGHAEQVEQLRVPAPAAMSNSSVREALDASVTCSPVSLKISHESTVPNSARPARARSRRPSTCSSSHSIFVAEKYGSSTSPVRARTSASWPLLAQFLAARGRAPVLPDDRVVQRLAAVGVPHADGLALVGDPHRRELARAHAGVARAPRPRPPASPPRSRARRARPSPAAGSAARTRGRRARSARRARRRRGSVVPVVP